jgi:16S rRNA (uracil1498-N3)-methyltransferase
MSQFLINKDNLDIENKKILLTKKDSDFHHIFKVFRIKENEIVKFLCIENSDKNKTVFAKLKNFDDNLGEFEILEVFENKNEKNKNNIKITLCQCVPKLNKIDLIIEKAVELGISNFIPVISKNVIVKLDKKSENQKIDRWKEIVISSVKQCENPFIPKMFEVKTFEELIKNKKNIEDVLNYNIIAWENGKSDFKNDIAFPLKNFIKLNQNTNKLINVNILVGSEGGFQKEEIEMAENFGWKSFRLNGNILRTETAGIVILSLLKYELGLF